MVNFDEVMDAINARIGRVLLYGEASLPESQFKAFRKLILDEFGHSGLRGDLARLFGYDEPRDRQGKGRPILAGKGGRA